MSKTNGLQFLQSQIDTSDDIQLAIISTSDNKHLVTSDGWLQKTLNLNNLPFDIFYYEQKM